MPVLAKYEVLEEIGHGGMATVYRAHDPRLGRDVAAKVIHPHLRDSLEAKQRFAVEAKAVAKLRHPNIVEVFDVSSEGDVEQYLVVELVRGATLRKVLAERGVLPPEVAASLAVEILAALAHAHATGVVHRDVKPENVMVEHALPSNEPETRPGDRVHVKLTDFGIAKLLDAQGVTSTGQVLGSPAHMAPEQIEGGDVDGRADVFGLGVLLYESMVGHLPFEGKNPAQVLRRVLEGQYSRAEGEDAKIGKRWSMVLDRSLARAPEDRYESAAAMQGALLAELRTLGVDSPRAELEAWFDDPAAYGERHDAARISKLCELGRVARSRGDTLEAAAHFNRALAYAPHDPALLKIVASMHRARASRDLTRRVVPLVLASAALGTTAFYVTRAIKHRALRAFSDVAAPSPSAASSASVTAGTTASPGPDPTTSPSARPRVPIPFPVQVRPMKPVERRITLGPTHPPFGVLVAIDGASLGDAHEGLVLSLDGKAHDLTFTCKKDECVPMVKSLPAGDESSSFPVNLEIKPATVVVEGDPSLVYGLEEFPAVTLRVGVPVPVPVTHGNYAVHVVERTSGKRVTWRLDPGREVRVSFPAGDEAPPAQ